MQDAYRHCEALVRAADKDRFLATLFAPMDKRGALYALYAFNVEITRVGEIVREPMAGEIRLQWWREVLAGERAGEAAANPVAAALLDTIARCSLPVAPLIALIEARAFDLYDDPMPTLEALEAYLRATSSTVIAQAARILVGEHPAMAEAALHAGLAYGMTGWLRAGRQQVAFVDLQSRAGTHLAAAKALMPRLPAAAAPAFLPVSLVRGDLAHGAMPQWRRQWVLWRAARRYGRIMRG
jgi:15-cis-phytoene synthase